MKNAIAYLRCSTEEQNKGDTFTRQTANVEAYCQRNQLHLEKILIDDGKSAYKNEHLLDGELGKLRSEVMAGKYRNYAIVIEDLDRLSRSGILKTMSLVSDFTDAGLEIHQTLNGQVIRSLDDLGTAVMTVVRSSAANEYSKKLQERKLNSWKSKRAKAADDGFAMTSLVPSWLTTPKLVKGKGGPITVIPERAVTVRKIFKLAASGLGAYRIAAKLTTDGDEPFGKKGWTLPYIKLLLKNRAVLGDFQPRTRTSGKRLSASAPIPNFYPAVISHEEWDDARQSVAKRTKNYLNSKTGEMQQGWKGGRSDSDKNLFTGLLFDKSLDGRKIVFRGKTGRAKASYLITAYEAGKLQHSTRYDRFEKAFLSFLEDLDWKVVGSHGETDEVKAASAQLEEVLAEVDRCSVNIARMEQLVADGMFSKSLFESLDTEKSKLVNAVTQKDKLASEVASARGKFSALRSPDELIALIKGGNPELRPKLKNEIGKRVAKIELEFKDRTPVQATIVFINQFRRFLLFAK